MLRTLALICIATPALAGEPVETREIVLRCGRGTIRVNPVTKVTHVGCDRSIATTLNERVIIIKDRIETLTIDSTTGNFSITKWNGETRSVGTCSEPERHEDAE